MRRPWPSLPLRCMLLSAFFAAAIGAPVRGTELARVFRCTQDGVVVFADRPCGIAPSDQGSFLLQFEQAEPQQGAAVGETAAPGPALDGHGARRSKSRASSSPGSSPGRPQPTRKSITERERRRLRCAALQQQIDRVDSLMRAGYHGARGEQLRDRRSDLKNRYLDEKCLGAH